MDQDASITEDNSTVSETGKSTLVTILLGLLLYLVSGVVILTIIAITGLDGRLLFLQSFPDVVRTAMQFPIILAGIGFLGPFVLLSALILLANLAIYSLLPLLYFRKKLKIRFATLLSFILVLLVFPLFAQQLYYRTAAYKLINQVSKTNEQQEEFYKYKDIPFAIIDDSLLTSTEAGTYAKTVQLTATIDMPVAGSISPSCYLAQKENSTTYTILSDHITNLREGGYGGFMLEQGPNTINISFAGISDSVSLADGPYYANCYINSFFTKDESNMYMTTETTPGSIFASPQNTIGGPTVEVITNNSLSTDIYETHPYKASDIK